MASIDTRTDWAEQEAYWRTNYKHRPYFESGQSFDVFAPAYRFGYEATDRYHGRNWDDVEFDLRRDWDRYKDRGKYLVGTDQSGSEGRVGIASQGNGTDALHRAAKRG